eukprot:TRINITY_DN3503_c1_g1_i1.p1 TRINITY_DN3503_c1_g1~~TRINITY_DN3503_c1_g1_i1.p1  ORF type:complete len:307 (+),score=56.68 TRINITY_DN3503_c1_g1_i1:2-922(+)
MWWWDGSGQGASLVLGCDDCLGFAACPEVGKVVHGQVSMLKSAVDVGLRRCSRLWLRVNDRSLLLPYSAEVFGTPEATAIFSSIPPSATLPTTTTVHRTHIAITIQTASKSIPPRTPNTTLPPSSLAFTVVDTKPTIVVSTSSGPIELPYPLSVIGKLLMPITTPSITSVTVGRRVVKCVMTKPGGAFTIYLELMSNSAADNFAAFLPLTVMCPVEAGGIAVPNSWRVAALRPAKITRIVGVLYATQTGATFLKTTVDSPEGTTIARPRRMDDTSGTPLPNSEIIPSFTQFIANQQHLMLSFTTLF